MLPRILSYSLQLILLFFTFLDTLTQQQQQQVIQQPNQQNVPSQQPIQQHVPQPMQQNVLAQQPVLSQQPMHMQQPVVQHVPVQQHVPLQQPVHVQQQPVQVQQEPNQPVHHNPPQQNIVNWFENLPAVALDYKVHIDPGKEDCYFQFVNPGATFYVSFQVLRGGDGMAGFAVRHPNGQIVHPYQWRAHSDYQDHQSTGGYYSVCIDNQFSRFADKLVNLYITVIRYDQWDQYTKEMSDLNVSVENFTSSIMTVERNINDMLQYQNHLRGSETRDFNLISDNNSYVLNWSLIQIMVIIGTTVLQVHFVRRLFEAKPGKTRV